METWIRVKTKEQLEAVQQSQVRLEHLVLDAAFVLAEPDLDGAAAVRHFCREAFGEDLKIYLQLPDVLRQNKKAQIKALLEKALSGSWYDGLVVKNLDELGLVLEVQAQEPFAIVGDAFLYAYNRDALSFYRELVPDMKFICSEELTDKEEKELIDDKEAFIYKVYGYQTVMITAQCFRKNHGGCGQVTSDCAAGRSRTCSRTALRDETGNILYAENDCSLCHTVIYNSVPTSMLDKISGEYENIFYDFTIEDAETVKNILTSGQCSTYTRGHHLTSVD